MKIKNISNRDVELTDLYNPFLGTNRFILKPNEEKEVFNEDAEKSRQLKKCIELNLLKITSIDEPYLTKEISEVETDVSGLSPGIFGGQPGEKYIIPCDLDINGDFKVNGTIYTGDVFNISNIFKIRGVIIETTAEELNALGTIVIREIPLGVIDGVNKIFELAHTPKANQECVYLDGILQNSGVGRDYTISGKIITFNEAPPVGSTILVNYRY